MTQPMDQKFINYALMGTMKPVRLLDKLISPVARGFGLGGVSFTNLEELDAAFEDFVSVKSGIMGFPYL